MKRPLLIILFSVSLFLILTIFAVRSQRPNDTKAPVNQVAASANQPGISKEPASAFTVPESAGTEKMVTSTTDSAVKLHEIIISSEGFSPTQITIKVGETIVFRNSDSEERWPASNIHPSHKIYPEFDPKQAVEPGQSWKFEFDKVGSWRFHDHLWPDKTGVITVTANASSNNNNHPRSGCGFQ